VELRIRRSGERKFRWESYTNSRGEYALRVPQGSVYEIVVHVKGFADQSQSFDAPTGSHEGKLTFRMEPAAKGKK
jgi:hypothetical protein